MKTTFIGIGLCKYCSIFNGLFDNSKTPHLFVLSLHGLRPHSLRPGMRMKMDNKQLNPHPMYTFNNIDVHISNMHTLVYTQLSNEKYARMLDEVLDWETVFARCLDVPEFE